MYKIFLVILKYSIIKFLFTIQGNGVIWNGIRWVAVGQGTNTIGYSYDGITWTVGNTIGYSYDGITWTVGNTNSNLFTIGKGVGANSGVGPTNIKSNMTFNPNDNLTFNLDTYNNTAQNISVSFLTS